MIYFLSGLAFGSGFIMSCVDLHYDGKVSIFAVGQFVIGLVALLVASGHILVI